jgi:predicted secreted Zn-dependent protease
MRVISIFIFLVTSCLQLAAQKLVNDTKDLLEWNEYYQLSWDDFQGRPTPESIGDAGTAVNIKAKPYYIKHQIMYDVDVYFDRKRSWARAKSDALLRHEQVHFDIAELYARKIRKRVTTLQENGVSDIKIYNAAIKEILEESNEADQEYDLETLHGALTKKQLSWERRVKEQLQGLKDYKKRKKVITANDALKKRQLIFG